MKESIKLKAMEDGEWGDGSSPDFMDILITDKGEDQIIQARNLIKESDMHGLEISSHEFLVECLFDDEDNMAQMLGTASAVITESDVYFRVATKHGYEYAMSESIDLKAILAERNQSIFIKWNVDDILGQMEGREQCLTAQEAYTILERLKQDHDANTGINYQAIDTEIEKFLKEKADKIYTVMIHYHDDDEPMEVLFAEYDDTQEDDQIFFYGVSKIKAKEMIAQNNVDFGDFKLVEVED